MKKSILISMIAMLSINCYSQSSSLLILYKHTSGMTFGTLDNTTGVYNALSDTLCYGSFWSTLDPVNGHFIFKSQELPGVNTSKIYTVDIYTGNIIDSITTVPGNDGVRQIEYNPFDSALYALYKHNSGITFGTLDNTTGVYNALSDTLCYGSFWSTLDPVNGHFIFKSQELPGVNTSKIYTVDIYTGNIIDSITTVPGNDGIKQIEFNPCDSTLYALYKHNSGITFGTLDNTTGVYNALSDTLCYGSFWSTLDPVNGHFIFKSQELPGVNTSKIYTVDIYTGNIIDSITTVPGNDGIRQMDNNYECSTITNLSLIENPVSHISLYPNPINEFINIYLDKEYSNIVIEIIDQLGRVIQKNNFKNNSQISLNSSSLSNGFYFVKVLFDDEQRIIKVYCKK